MFPESDALGLQPVNEDGDEDDGAINDALHVRFHAGEVHAVPNHTNDDDPDQCAQDFSLTAGQAGAPDNDSGNDL